MLFSETHLVVQAIAAFFELLHHSFKLREMKPSAVELHQGYRCAYDAHKDQGAPKLERCEQLQIRLRSMQEHVRAT